MKSLDPKISKVFLSLSDVNIVKVLRSNRSNSIHLHKELSKIKKVSDFLALELAYYRPQAFKHLVNNLTKDQWEKVVDSRPSSLRYYPGPAPDDLQMRVLNKDPSLIYLIKHPCTEAIEHVLMAAPETLVNLEGEVYNKRTCFKDG